MSSSNTNTSLAASVPTLTSLNYLQWKPKMMNFLHASTLYWVICTIHPEYTGENTSELSDWDNDKDHALGHIFLKMDANLANHYQDKETTAAVWSGLETQFFNVSVTFVFMEFKVMMDTTIPENQHPAPAFSKMTAHFVHLKEFKYKVPNKVQVMIVLAKIRRYMDTIAQLLNLSSPDSTSTTIAKNWMMYSKLLLILI
ncbi:hypothetical protein BS17DRAFT_812847 [Gyrodon lividus]|nr:hypothetical protein BS17DRAFT_812847 [Gyrodon lividus]